MTPAGAAAPATTLPAFLALYGALYGAYGSESAYMPAFLHSHGLAVERIGLVLASGTLARIAAGPAIGRLADRSGRRKPVLMIAAALSGLVGSTYLLAYGLPPLLAISMAHAAVTASLAPLSDALSVAAASDGRGFRYGWVRGAGSGAFVAGTLLSGQLIGRWGLSCIIVSSSVLFLATAVCATRVDDRLRQANPSDGEAARSAFSALWAIPAYRWMTLVVVLVIGSQALNDAFAVIGWRAAGYGSPAIGLLWSESVASEVVVFFLLGPWLLARLGPARCAGLSAAAGVLRWSVMGATTALPAIVGAQALHGLTFALLHMVAMDVIAASVPRPLAGTAQTVYGAFALGLASAALTFGSGYLYAWLGMRSFFAMAVLCALALPWVGRLSAGAARPALPDAAPLRPAP